MTLIGNIIWILLGGIWTALGWLLLGAVFCITVVGIPLGLQCFKMASLTLTPFGKRIEYGGGAPSFVANVFWLILGGWYGGLAGAVGLGIADILDPVYITGAPKTFVLKFCIGLITGLIAHRIAKINESRDKKYIFRWSMIASAAGLAFNVIADPLAGFFYNQYILGQPQQIAGVLAKWSTATTFVNAVLSLIIAGALYNALRPILLKTGIIHSAKINTAGTV